MCAPQTGTLGILAGGGAVPAEIAQSALRAGRGVVVVGIQGEVEPERFAASALQIVNWGQIGAMLAAFKQGGVRDLVIVGRVRRPDLWRLRTDWGFWRSLPTVARIVASGGDDGVLRGVVRFFEAHGFRVVGPGDVAPDLVLGPGPLGRAAFEAAEEVDATVGFDVLARIAPFDVGQAAVVRSGRLIAIEGADGTDGMLRRLVERRQHERGGVLVKRAKPGQELRIDMPTIGPQTVRRVVDAGLSGIAVEAGATLAAERSALIDVVNRTGCRVVGYRLAPIENPVASQASAVRQTSLETTDAGIAHALLRALQDRTDVSGCVVVGRHVLAIACEEPIGDLLDRLGVVKPWGLQRIFKQRGVLGIFSNTEFGSTAAAAARAAGLSGIVIVQRQSQDGEGLERAVNISAIAQVHGLRVHHNETSSISVRSGEA